MVDQAWIHRKVESSDVGERREAAMLFGDNFVDFRDKDAAWKDLIRLTGDEDSDVRWRAADALSFTFQHFLDEDESWEDLHRVTWDKDRYVRMG